MFETTAPHIFALPPGVDFPAELVAGLKDRMAGEPPEAMGRVTLYLNTARMRRRVEEAFRESGSGFLPKLPLVSDLARDPRLFLPPATSALRRRLELTTLIAALLDQQPDIAPRAALYDLADSLAVLMDEMQGEGVSPDAVAKLDVSNHSQHWARTQAFLKILAPLFAGSGDKEALQRLAVMRLSAMWRATPPQGPVLIAGSTGSRGTTALFMQVVAQLPQGALILPGFDFDTPASVWNAMEDSLTAEDHPQFRFRRLMDLIAFDAGAVRPWRDVAPPTRAATG